MSLRGKSLDVLTPMYGGNLSINYHHSFNHLVARCIQLGIPIESSNIYNESLISRARNRLVDNFLKNSTATHALFCDADISFQADDILAMLEMDEPIIGVPCSKKSIRFDRIQDAIARRVIAWMHATPACRNGHSPDELFRMLKESGALFDPAKLPYMAGDFVMNPPKDAAREEVVKRIVADPTHLEPMRSVGTGLLMIKREVFLRFQKCYPDRYYFAPGDPTSNPGPIHDFFKCGVHPGEKPEEREYLSEDYWFCSDAIQIGYQVLLLPYVKTTHMGTYSFYGDMPAALACAGEIF